MPFTRESDIDSVQFKRESAEETMPQIKRYAALATCGTLLDVASCSSKHGATSFLHRYPSPDRPAYSPSRPMTVISTLFRLIAPKKTVDIGYQAEIFIDPDVGHANWGGGPETTTGLRLCKRHQSSSRQWQYLVWQVALRATQSVALQARALALLPQKCLAQIAQGQCLQALPLACFATTRASTAAVNSRALTGRINSENRHRGQAPVAVFAF